MAVIGISGIVYKLIMYKKMKEKIIVMNPGNGKIPCLDNSGAFDDTAKPHQVEEEEDNPMDLHPFGPPGENKAGQEDEEKEVY